MSFSSLILLLKPYAPILGALITAFAAWLAITRKIRYSILHEKRAQVVGDMYANAIELRDSVRVLGYDWYPTDKLTEQISRIKEISQKISMQQRDALYLNNRTARLLGLLRSHAQWLCYDFQNALLEYKPGSEGGGIRSEQEIKEAVNRVREISVAEIEYAIPRLMEKLKFEFQKLLGVESRMSRLAFTVGAWNRSAFVKLRSRSRKSLLSSQDGDQAKG